MDLYTTQVGLIRPPRTKPATRGTRVTFVKQSDNIIVRHRLRVLVIDDHELILQLIRTALEPEFDVVECTTDGTAALHAAAALVPDIALIDLNLPGIDSIELGSQVRSQAGVGQVVFLDTEPHPVNAARAFDMGAAGYIAKTRPVSELLDALRAAAQGGTFLTPVIAEGDLTRLRGIRLHRKKRELSPREEAVLQFVLRGLTMKEIAFRLGISSRTVAFHKYRGMRALGVRTNADLVALAIRQGRFNDDTE